MNRRGLLSGLGAALVAVLANAAMAQPAAEQPAGLPLITARHVQSYSTLLGLTPDQREVVLLLHESYIASAREEDQRLREVVERVTAGFERLQDFGGTPPAPGEIERRRAEGLELRQEVVDANLAHVETMEKLQEGFFSDMKAVLDGPQTEAWPRVERMRRREMILRDGGGFTMSWVAVDLTDVMLGLEIETSSGGPETSEIRELILRYEVEMDRVLDPLWTYAKKKQDEFQDARDMGPEQVRETMRQVIGWVKDARGLNKEYARRLGVLLPEEARAAFEAEVRFRAFPRVYRKSPTAEAIETAMGFSDLDESQLGSVSRLWDQYGREAADLNLRWAEAVDSRDTSFEFEDLRHEMMDPQTPVAVASRAREELDRAFRGRLTALLTAEQMARLPQPPENRRLGSYVREPETSGAGDP